MTRDRWIDDPKALEEAEKVYAFIGMYVICFQWFEDKFDEIFTLGKGIKNSKETQSWLVKKTFSDKLKTFRKFARDESIFHPSPQKGWYENFDLIMDEIDAERERRNSLVHSSFLFDFLAIDQPVISTEKKKVNGEAQFVQNELSSENRDRVLKEIADLSFRFSMACVQLRNLAKNP